MSACDIFHSPHHCAISQRTSVEATGAFDDHPGWRWGLLGPTKNQQKRWAPISHGELEIIGLIKMVGPPSCLTREPHNERIRAAVHSSCQHTHSQLTTQCLARPTKSIDSLDFFFSSNFSVRLHYKGFFFSSAPSYSICPRGMPALLITICGGMLNISDDCE